MNPTLFLFPFSAFFPLFLTHPPTHPVIMTNPILPFNTKVEKAKAWFLNHVKNSLGGNQ